MSFPRLSLGQEFGELRLEYTEFVVPRVAHDPEVESAFLLVIPAGSPECLQALDFRLNVVGLYVKVHAFFRDLLIVGPLKKDSYL